MDQAEFELQLKVWKDLAVSKQMLMNAATEALGLSRECTMDELKTALLQNAKRGKEADAEIAKAQEQAQSEIDAMAAKLAAAVKARDESEAAKNNALAAQEQAEQQMGAAREANAAELKKAKAQVVEKGKQLKAINTALADTPDNVVKKLKALKKQKNDEASAKQKYEAEARNLRKEKQELEQKLEELEKALENAGKLAEQYRELHKQCGDQREQLKEKGVDGDSLVALPELDEELLESVTKSEAKKDLASAA